MAAGIKEWQIGKNKKEREVRGGQRIKRPRGNAEDGFPGGLSAS